MNGQLHPDFSWVPAELGSFIGGIQAICIVLLVIATVVGVLRFVLAKVTSTRIDDAIGDRVLISVIIACFFISGLGQLVGHEMHAWDTTTVHVAAERNATAGDRFATPAQRQANKSSQEASKAAQATGEAFKNAWEKLRHGNVQGGVQDLGQGFLNAFDTVGKTGQSWWDKLQAGGLGALFGWGS